MKKVVLFGNCQLETIAFILARCAAHEVEVLPVPPVHAITEADSDGFRRAMESCDAAYVHFASDRFGPYATDRLMQEYGGKVWVLPNLEFEAYTPQVNYFSDGTVMATLGYVDFRLVEMYLQKMPFAVAALLYHQADIVESEVTAILHRRIGRCLHQFVRGEVIADYSRRLAERALGSRLFLTHNHPIASELIWVANIVLKHLDLKTRINEAAHIGGLLDYIVAPVLDPVARLLGIARDGFPVVLGNTAMEFDRYCGLHYQEYARMDRAFLRRELETSLWARCRAL